MGSGGRKAETVTTENEDNTEQLAREECSRLARQLRLMENDKKAYLDESNAQIAHQRKTMTAIEKENSKLQSELDIYKSKYSKEKDGANVAKLIKVIDRYKEMDEDVKQQTKLSLEVEKKLNLTGGRVSKLKAKLEALEKEDDLPLTVLERKEFILKKKLETVTGQFDAVVASNTELRNEIDEILTQNIAVMEKNSQLEKQCEKVKNQVAEIVDQATNAYDQREEAVAKAEALTERNVKEKKLYTMEISELGRIIRHEEKLLDFMSTKNKERHFLETDDERLSRLEHAKEQTLDETLESYRVNFGKLLTPETLTIQDLVQEFKDLQYDNINRFTYINDLNNEVEALQEETNGIREDIKRYTIETVERNKSKNFAIIKKEIELDELRVNYRYVLSDYTKYKTVMEDIVRMIERLFNITDCTGTAPVLDLLGGNQQKISTSNASLYVNILEHRITDIFGLKFNNVHGGTPSLRSPRPGSKAVSDVSGVTKPRIVVTAEQESEEIVNSDDDVAQGLLDAVPSPLAYSEMREKVLDAVNSRRSTSSASGEDYTNNI